MLGNQWLRKYNNEGEDDDRKGVQYVNTDGTPIIVEISGVTLEDMINNVACSLIIDTKKGTYHIHILVNTYSMDEVTMKNFPSQTRKKRSWESPQITYHPCGGFARTIYHGCLFSSFSRFTILRMRTNT